MDLKGEIMIVLHSTIIRLRGNTYHYHRNSHRKSSFSGSHIPEGRPRRSHLVKYVLVRFREV